ncbi:MAG TPA: DMT family transporter, partial [Aestuariivirga sp.]|nr:DMT family transporter [Aestuariivirga sp.]
MHHTSNLRGIVFMVLAGGTFVANDSFMKLVLADAPPMQVLFMRGLAAFLWCLPLVFILGYGRDIHRVVNPWVLLRAAFEILAVTSFILALNHMPIGDITAIFQISPLFVVIGVSLIWGEKIGPLRTVLIALGLTGALLVAQPGSTSASPYAAFGFLTAIGSALRDLAGRKVPHNIPGIVVALTTIIAVMVAAGLSTVGFETWVPPSNANILKMLAAGLFLVGGHTFVFLAFRFAKAAAVAPFYYTFTLWAMLSGLVVFG